jgi:hypothetical protein
VDLVPRLLLSDLRACSRWSYSPYFVYSIEASRSQLALTMRFSVLYDAACAILWVSMADAARYPYSIEPSCGQYELVLNRLCTIDVSGINL